MNEYDLKRLFPGASASTIRRNQDCDGLSNPIPKPAVRNEPLAASPRKTQGTTRFAVSITSYRLRELDTDNLAGGCKFVVDSLRYGRLIPNDSPKDIALTIRQEKVASKAQERTEIEIRPI